MFRSAKGLGVRTPWALLKPLGRLDLERPVAISRQTVLIGSHSRVHLPLRSRRISRCHALIVMDLGECYLRDLASREGVAVNGRIIREHRLVDGDVLCIGPFAFRWQTMPVGPFYPRHLGQPAIVPAATLIESSGTRTLAMKGRSLLIGQRAACDLALAHAMVSPAHAIIYRREGRHVVRDLNTHSGTFVNSRRVHEAELRPGDEIRIGLAFLRYELSTAAATDRASASCSTPLERLMGLGGMANIDAPLEAARCLTIDELLAEANPSEGPPADLAAPCEVNINASDAEASTAGAGTHGIGLGQSVLPVCSSALVPAPPEQPESGERRHAR